MKSSFPAARKQKIRHFETDSGAYQLVFQLEHETTIAVGALGCHKFPRGKYVYTGRALIGLNSRIMRHLRTEKKLRWHIDYIPQEVCIEEILVYPGKAAEECAISNETARLLEGIFPVKGFGSSDCRCSAHLQLIPETQVGKLDALPCGIRLKSSDTLTIHSCSVHEGRS